MKNFKKLLQASLVVALLLTFTACGHRLGNNHNEAPNPSPTHHMEQHEGNREHGNNTDSNVVNDNVHGNNANDNVHENNNLHENNELHENNHYGEHVGDTIEDVIEGENTGMRNIHRNLGGTNSDVLNRGVNHNAGRAVR